MPKFGKSSLRNLAEVDLDLQRLFKRVVETYDCSIIEGYRTKEKQDEYCEIASEVENIMETFFEKGV